jgi:hypothetical protein
MIRGVREPRFDCILNNIRYGRTRHLMNYAGNILLLGYWNLRWAGHVAGIGDTRTGFWWGILLGNFHLGKTRRKRKDDIEVDLEKIG